MAPRLKTDAQIEQMRKAGRVVRRVLKRLGEMVAPGVTTLDLDREAERICSENGAVCLFKGVPGRGRAGPFPGNICASINEEIVHGIPSDKRVIREGDIVSIDFGVRLDGWCGDAAETFVVGEISAEKRQLVDVTRNALSLAIEMCRPNGRWSEVAQAMQEYVESQGLSVVREFVGHGIGRDMHEDPRIPNWLSRELRHREIPLAPGTVLAIEPMVNLGVAETDCLADGWTVVTRDRKASAHFEQTVAITSSGVTVLTAEE